MLNNNNTSTACLKHHFFLIFQRTQYQISTTVKESYQKYMRTTIHYKYSRFDMRKEEGNMHHNIIIIIVTILHRIYSIIV